MQLDPDAASLALQPISNVSATSTTAEARASSATRLLDDPHSGDGETNHGDAWNSIISSSNRESHIPSPPPRHQDASSAVYEKKPLLNKTGRFMLGKDSWLWEITSLVFSAACVVAIVAVLISKQGTPLDAWGLSIAPNTVISVLATVSKASLLFPVAESISQLKWLHFNRAQRLSDLDLYNNASRGPLGALVFIFQLPLDLGALGAIITIVALAFDPFAQQLVSFPSRQAALHNETASFRVSQAYESGAYYNPQNSITDYTDFAMQGAIYNGVFGSPSPRAFKCPTSQCTWPNNSSYITLGVTGECKNVTDSATNDCNFPMNSRSGDCTITTPGGYSLTSKRQHQSATFQYTSLNTTVAASSMDGDLIKFAIWRLTGSSLSEFEVFECRLSLTAYLYRNISATQNNLNIAEEIQIPLEPAGSPNSGLNLFRPSSSAGQFPPQVMFAFHGADYAKVVEVLDEIFTAEAMIPFGQPTALTTDVLVAGNLSRIVEDIAWGMTERIRTGRNSTVAEGVVYYPETYIQVDWPWITLPVLVVIGAGILLVCSIIDNSRHSGTLWKSSNVAMLLHSLEGAGEYRYLSGSGKDAPLARIDDLAEKLRVFRSDNMEFTPRD